MLERTRLAIYRLLRRSESYTKTDMVYLAKGSFWLTILQVTGTISGFFLSVAFANFFPKHEYGIYKYILSVGGIIGAFTLTGLGPAIMQAVAKGSDGVLREGFFINLRWSAPSTIAAIVGGLYYLLHGNTTLGFSFFIIAAATPLLNSSGLYGFYLNGKKDFRRVSIYGAIRNVVPTICLIASIFVTTNPIAIVAVYFVSNLLVSLLCYWLTIRAYKPPRTEDEDMLSYSKHLSFMSVLNIIADNIDKVIVFQHVGSVELAIYTFATAVPTQIKGVLKNIPQLALPKYANQTVEEIKANIFKKMIQLALFILPIVLGYIIAAPYIYELFFPQYMEAVPYSQVFSISLLFYISILTTTALQAKRAVSSLYKTNFLVAISKIVILILFAYQWGLWGVVIARVVYEVFAVFFSAYFFFHAKENV